MGKRLHYWGRLLVAVNLLYAAILLSLQGAGFGDPVRQMSKRFTGWYLSRYSA
jgi:hypothetical protein